MFTAQCASQVLYLILLICVLHEEFPYLMFTDHDPF